MPLNAADMYNNKNNNNKKEASYMRPALQEDNGHVALLHILVDCPAADHAALRAVRRTFRHSRLNFDENASFRNMPRLRWHVCGREKELLEEVEKEWQEYQVENENSRFRMERVDFVREDDFLPVERCYVGCRGILTNLIRICVDGKIAGEGKVTLVLRGNPVF